MFFFLKKNNKNEYKNNFLWIKFLVLITIKIIIDYNFSFWFNFFRFKNKNLIIIISKLFVNNVHNIIIKNTITYCYYII